MGGGGEGDGEFSVGRNFFPGPLAMQDQVFFFRVKSSAGIFFRQTLFSRLLIPVGHHMSANLRTSSSCHNYLITPPHHTLCFHMFTLGTDHLL